VSAFAGADFARSARHSVPRPTHEPGRHGPSGSGTGVIRFLIATRVGDRWRSRWIVDAVVFRIVARAAATTSGAAPGRRQRGAHVDHAANRAAAV